MAIFELSNFLTVRLEKYMGDFVFTFEREDEKTGNKVKSYIPIDFLRQLAHSRKSIEKDVFPRLYAAMNSCHDHQKKRKQALPKYAPGKRFSFSTGSRGVVNVQHVVVDKVNGISELELQWNKEPGKEHAAMQPLRLRQVEWETLIRGGGYDKLLIQLGRERVEKAARKRKEKGDPNDVEHFVFDMPLNTGTGWLLSEAFEAKEDLSG